uniref:Uncharacterized protein n=1 Tax=Populus trichocarpa TaxID=3694 RepID=A0A3N7FH23_POPTR
MLAKPPPPPLSLCTSLITRVLKPLTLRPYILSSRS